MYQFSRSIYRDLIARIDTSEGVERTFAARRKVLESCEATIERLVCDRRYFARPALACLRAVPPTSPPPPTPRSAHSAWPCSAPPPGTPAGHDPARRAAH